MIGTSVKARSGRSGERWADAILRAGSQVFETLAALRRASLERAQLLSLNERELRDIGISRIDAIREADRPLRQWRSH